MVFRPSSAGYPRTVDHPTGKTPLQDGPARCHITLHGKTMPEMSLPVSGHIRRGSGSSVKQRSSPAQTDTRDKTAPDKMKFLYSLSLFATATSALSILRRTSPLHVELEMVGNSEVKATITNTGEQALKLFKTGTILDSAPVEKTEIFSGASKIPFDGIRLRIQTGSLDASAFEHLAAGESITKTWDIAQVHDLSAGGAITISSSGFIPYAVDATTNTLAAEPIAFNTNALTATVDGASAAKVRRSFHALAERQAVQSDCTGTKLTQTNTALTACASLAARASTAATSGSAAKMEEYFKSSSSSTRSTVAGIFRKVATECGGGRVSKQYCSDVYGACSNGVLAYTLPSQSYMVNCPLYFSGLAQISSTCHAQDKATTTLHETTHLSQIAGTTDQNGCYGYNCVRSLSASQNLRHADTFALFANALYAGC